VTHEEKVISSSIIFSVSDDSNTAIQAAKPDVLFYFLYPELDPVIEYTPYKADVDKIRKLAGQGQNKEALSLVTDEMVERLAVAGTPKECQEKIKKLDSYGITLPIIRVSVQPFTIQERKDVFLRAIDTLKDIAVEAKE
jgi:5,10-methylenetetrahydromethanopterin reductase